MHPRNALKEPGSWILLLSLALTLYLAVTRVYQVDEAQTVYMASVLAHKWQGDLFTSGQLHLFPLALLVQAGWAAGSVFLVFRLTFLALFWLNMVLIVLASGLRLRSMAGFRALALAGTVAPLWAYGLECRHDNILLTCTLLFWILGRRTGAWPRGPVFAGLGALALLTQACLFKSVATWAPLSLLLFLIEPCRWGRRAVLALYWCAGAAAMYGATFAIRTHAGLRGMVNEGTGALGQAMSLERTLPTHALHQLLQTAPLLAAAMAALLVYGFLNLHSQGARAAAGAPAMAETGFFAVGVLAFLANPTPFPYNLAVLSAMALVPMLRLGRPWLEPGALAGRSGLPYIVVAGLVLHGLPLATRFAALAETDNQRQEAIMTMAEALTGPDDPVFDAIGLLPTRKGPSRQWLINLANVRMFDRTSMTGTWAGHVPPVVLPSYRFGYLQPADLEFIRANYLPLRKDLYLLGQILPQPEGETRAWTCLRSGRYAVTPTGQGLAGLTLDGKPLAPGIHWLSEGPHSLATTPGSPCLLAWAGPLKTFQPELRPAEGMDTVCPVPMSF